MVFWAEACAIVRLQWWQQFLVAVALRHFDPILKAEVWPRSQKQLGQSSLCFTNLFISYYHVRLPRKAARDQPVWQAWKSELAAASALILCEDANRVSAKAIAIIYAKYLKPFWKQSTLEALWTRTSVGVRVKIFSKAVHSHNREFKGWSVDLLTIKSCQLWHTQCCGEVCNKCGDCEKGVPTTPPAPVLPPVWTRLHRRLCEAHHFVKMKNEISSICRWQCLLACQTHDLCTSISDIRGYRPSHTLYKEIVQRNRADWFSKQNLTQHGNLGLFQLYWWLHMIVLDLHAVLSALKRNQQWWSLHRKLSVIYFPVPWNPLKMNTNTKRADAMGKIIKACFWYLWLCCWIFMVFCALKRNQQWWSLHRKFSVIYFPVPWNPLKMNTNTKRADAMGKIIKACFWYLWLCCWIFMVFCALKRNQQWWSLHTKLSSTCQRHEILWRWTQTSSMPLPWKNWWMYFFIYLLLCWIFMLPSVPKKTITIRRLKVDGKYSLVW